jgi:hypothetical protein
MEYSRYVKEKAEDDIYHEVFSRAIFQKHGERRKKHGDDG